MSYQTLLVERHGTRAEVTINRPQSLNALNRQVMSELTDALKSFGADPSLRTVILTGAGEKAFVAGADIAEMQSLDAEGGRAFSRVGWQLGETLASIDKVVVAAVNGFALGGGCELALACDFIYASDKAKFGQPEVKLAVIPGFGGTQRLARRVGGARALELCAVGDPISAEEALRIGLCNAVHPAAELLDAARKVCDKIAERGPLAVAAVKRAVRASYEMSLAQGLELEVELFGKCFASEDQKEGMRAFLEKRAPKFQGR